jgi:beta-cyano-L-alanine hydratase/nitrilase
MSTFGAVVGLRSDEGREEFQKYHAAAIDIPSPAIVSLENVSKVTGVFLVVGVIERDLGTLYCTAVFVDPEDGYVGKHRKLMPTGSERLIWGFGDASTLPVLERPFVAGEGKATSAKLSATICWYGTYAHPHGLFLMPFSIQGELYAIVWVIFKTHSCPSAEIEIATVRTYYYSKGVEIYCAPTVDARPEWQSTMRHIALEGRCFVLSACQFSKEQDYPPDHSVADPANRNPDNVMIAGGSVIISPLGKVLAGPLLGQEGVLIADLDLDEIAKGKFDLDVVGHYARPDSE